MLENFGWKHSYSRNFVFPLRQVMVHTSDVTRSLYLYAETAEVVMVVVVMMMMMRRKKKRMMMMMMMTNITIL